MFDDDKPKPKPVYTLGQNISDCSVAELDDMISNLLEEAERLKAERKKKAVSIDAAAALFRN